MNVIEDIKDDQGNVVRRRVRFYTQGDDLTKQAMKSECDINGIMKRYERTGVITHLAKRESYFADVSNVPDFASALAVVEKAQVMFDSLPAVIRKEFANDAAAYVQFCADPANLPRMRELGIAKPAPEIKPVPGIVVPPLVKEGV